MYMKNKKSNNKSIGNVLFKKNARPKQVLVMLERSKGGKYHVIGAEYLNEINQYAAQWRRLDARDVASELRRAATGKRKLTVN